VSEQLTDLMRGRVCVVTGATRGLGRATAHGLARQGARVVLMVRDVVAGSRVSQEIVRQTRNDDIGFIPLDLASFESVRRAAAVMHERFDAVHVLVNNAGVNLARRAESEDGHEMTLAVNHLGPFLLTRLLEPLLRAGAPSRVVTVTSGFERLGRIHFDDLDLRRGYNGIRAYTQSKLANVLFTYALAERWQGSGVTANCIHPGLVATDLMRDLPRWMRALYESFLSTPERAAVPIVRLASAPELWAVTGRYFDRTREALSSRRSYDIDARERLWRVSEQITRRQR
jgi:NAD(P)-dependent dehydrogenase (short-subunit alcohol dehydrogenase family)